MNAARMILMFAIACAYGLLMGILVSGPAGFILAFIGGGLIGWFSPSLFDYIGL